MQTKLFEIRDRMTFIPCVAMLCESEDEQENYLLRREGYSDRRFVLFGKLNGSGTLQSDLYAHSNRTMREAHKYIQENWDILTSGQVVDVEFVLGETGEPKVSERLTTA